MNDFAPVYATETLAPVDADPVSPEQVRTSAGVCRYCGKLIERAAQAKYCSRKCLRRNEYQRNRANILARSVEYYYAHREHSNKKRRAYYLENLEPERTSRRAWNEEHKEETAAKRTKQHRELYAKLRELVLNKFGRACAKCGERRLPVLQLDHVFGNGASQRRSRTSFFIMREAINDDSGRYQLLCANCNWMKRFDQKETAGANKTPAVVLTTTPNPKA